MQREARSHLSGAPCGCCRVNPRLRRCGYPLPCRDVAARGVCSPGSWRCQSTLVISALCSMRGSSCSLSAGTHRTLTIPKIFSFRLDLPLQGFCAGVQNTGRESGFCRSIRGQPQQSLGVAGMRLAAFGVFWRVCIPFRLERSRSTAAEWICEMRDSTTPRVKPISFIVSSS
jgi:hypothetical protein